MNLTYLPDQIIITFQENRIPNLVFENPERFTNFITTLHKQLSGEEGGIVLSNDDKKLKLEKNLILLTDFISLQLNDKKILNQLYKNMQDIGNEFTETKQKIIEPAVRVFDQLIGSMEYDSVTYDLDFTWTDLFKLFHVKVEEDVTSLEEKIIFYLRLCSELLAVRIVCLVNLKSYLSQNEISEIYKMALYYKLSLLMIEPRECKCSEIEDFYIIDSDSCLIIK